MLYTRELPGMLRLGLAPAYRGEWEEINHAKFNLCLCKSIPRTRLSKPVITVIEHSKIRDCCCTSRLLLHFSFSEINQTQEVMNLNDICFLARFVSGSVSTLFHFNAPHLAFLRQKLRKNRLVMSFFCLLHRIFKVSTSTRCVPSSIGAHFTWQHQTPVTVL